MKNGLHSSKKHQKVANNSPIKICLNKIEKRVLFKIKARYHVELLIPTTMKLLGNTKNKKNKNENSENVPNLETTEVVLLHCNIANNNY